MVFLFVLTWGGNISHSKHSDYSIVHPPNRVRSLQRAYNARARTIMIEALLMSLWSNDVGPKISNLCLAKVGNWCGRRMSSPVRFSRMWSFLRGLQYLGAASVYIDRPAVLFPPFIVSYPSLSGGLSVRSFDCIMPSVLKEMVREIRMTAGSDGTCTAH